MLEPFCWHFVHRLYIHCGNPRPLIPRPRRKWYCTYTFPVWSCCLEIYFLQFCNLAPFPYFLHPLPQKPYWRMLGSVKSFLSSKYGRHLGVFLTLEMTCRECLCVFYGLASGHIRASECYPRPAPDHSRPFSKPAQIPVPGFFPPRGFWGNAHH